MVDKSKRLSSLAYKFGALGIAGLLISIVLSVAVFQDSEGNVFNFLNHTLSELGHYGHSTLAVMINGGLFFGSLSMSLFALFSIQLVDNKWLYPLFFSLAGTFFCLAAVGLFPVNVYHLHTAAIKYFFYLGTCSSALFCVYLIWNGGVFYSRWNIVTGTLTFISFSCFILLSHMNLGLIGSDQPFYQEMVMEVPRPILWCPVALEWLSLALFLAWCCGMVRSAKIRI
ncbi:hypothetical protein HWQ46_12725 [Shewanella sp. D64]|uniref:hypothetical protein n=1 Tax=unclassified Shewanella TaxID=196818 RepID=UPI0022BA1D17|nr:MULTISPECIES: hypothetical protein [unclassified Shewanella]MEC4726414.1 hypothetical protein [Shewanella sp. D64]MEC4738426.1 hypothetical protein [Shewanella sp. E94]WBJ94172.1 hypothetical protein HWQ47_20060 [Shewanella sp. MTB7]